MPTCHEQLHQKGQIGITLSPGHKDQELRLSLGAVFWQIGPITIGEASSSPGVMNGQALGQVEGALAQVKYHSAPPPESTYD